jgi:hypothetical protein
MASRNKPVTLSTGLTERKCAAGKRYAVAQLVPHRKGGKGCELVVNMRTNDARTAQASVRNNQGWHFVYDLTDGRLIWEGSCSSHWELESTLRQFEADRYPI